MSCRQKKARNNSHRSVYRIHYGLQRRDDADEMKPYNLYYKNMAGCALYKYGAQVAGHRANDEAKYLGLLQCNGTVLKPILKQSQNRERAFYEKLYKTDNKHLTELRNFIPTYFGCKKFTYNGYENDYIILKDIISGMFEPCIMDVKIGRRTWDPLATEEKIKAEQKKYAECKNDVAFCVPGFQVYSISGDLRKYGKEYGKKLRGETVREAMRVFLNAVNSKPCRSLILQFLTELWKLQKWASKQTAVRLYSTSLLLCYDTKRLRDYCGQNDDISSNLSSKCKVSPSLRTLRSVQSSNSIKSIESASNFSGQLSHKGPVYKKIKSVSSLPLQVANSAFDEPAIEKTPWHLALQHLQRSHSFHNNYEDNLVKIKLNYHSLLDDLSKETNRYKTWVSVKMIDFVHAFFTEGDEKKSIDKNFCEGIDNLVAIFEEFLQETEE